MAFSSTWLDLREPADHQARDAGLLARAAACVEQGGVVLDLGSGTGSTARAFNGHGDGWTWRFLDGDPDLLAVAAQRHQASEQVVADLADIAALPLDGVSLVTASALFDLMPEPWIEALAVALKKAKLPLYAALNYDGQMQWTPALPQDGAITEAFNRHQVSDKGIGIAAGPHAASLTARIFEAQGFAVHTADSPWQLGAAHATLQHELVDGIAQAAGEAGHAGAQAWLEARQAHNPQATAMIGHTDLLALPHAAH